MQHLHHFQLGEDPFRSDPLEKFDVDLTSQREAQARLDCGVRQGRGLVLLVGDAGSGKSRLARRLFEELEEEMFQAAMMVVLRREVGAEWLLERLARQLGVEEASTEREALIGQIYERLAIIHEDGRRTVLIIDDAHALANADALSALCGLVKLEYEDRRLLTVVLVGAPSLDAAFRADPLLAHQVELRVRLAPLEPAESARYVGNRIAAAGGSPELLQPGASTALHELAQGAPGRLNVLTANALYAAWRSGRQQLTRADVARAGGELGWAEMPRSDPSPALPEAGGMGSAEAHHTAVMDFDASPAREAPARSPLVEATEIELEDPVQEPPKDEDPMEALFTELIDD